MQVPDAIEPAIGYRVWLVKDRRLYSFAHSHIMWEPNKPFEAICLREHDVPSVGCSCGTYAAATFNRLFDMGYTRSSGVFAASEDKITIAGQGQPMGRHHPWAARLEGAIRLSTQAARSIQPMEDCQSHRR
jgi:hypothetical protein